MKTGVKISIAILALVLAGPALVSCSGRVKFGEDWRTADRSTTGIAPDPQVVEEAVVQVYAARAFNWRGAFAVHTWIATKAKGARYYTVHQVLGWRRFDDLPVVSSEIDVPDRSWYGQAPEVLVDLRGPTAEAAIEAINRAVPTYPFANAYGLWPGPNSNTFVAWIGRRVPQLKLDLPPTAIGKDFLEDNRVFASAPSGTGYQVSFYGALGVLLAWEEGLEINVLGVGLGLNPLKLHLRLPGLGIVGAS